MYYGAFQFPNLMINLHPDSVMAYLVYPNGPARTTVVSGQVADSAAWGELKLRPDRAGRQLSGARCPAAP